MPAPRPDDPQARTDTGVFLALMAFTIWGLSPLFFKQLDGISVWQVMAHRTLWAAVGLVLLGRILGASHPAAPSLAKVVGLLRERRTALTLVATTLFIATNWSIFLWAISEGNILATSLGYYINPLVLVVLGMVVLGERLRPAQAVAVLLAAAGIAWVLIETGDLPWPSLVIAVTFGLYALLRKRADLPAMTGLLAEVMLLCPLALGTILWFEVRGEGVLGTLGLEGVGLMMAAGLVTTVPLALHSAAGRRLTLATMGLVQYVAPSISFLIAVFWYAEPFTPDRQIMFACIWVALMIYTVEGWRHRRRSRTARLPAVQTVALGETAHASTTAEPR